ncbi:protein FAR1-RELATED SEQUENCE 12-like [Triticum aestivum]|uniref:protein FAR1-RELATED SEQUENCE 12-like n=1 Tax=Triticum aestivum TaxID=4565 RepID=UPI001D01FFAF|nr:protein FAR1-RELATED SEQUENCE 12-like [Triticum aestivum]
MSQAGGTTTAGGGGGGSVCLDSGEDKTKATTLQGETGQGEGKGEDAPISDEQDLNNANIEGWTRRERNRQGGASRKPSSDRCSQMEIALGNAGKIGQEVVFQPFKGMQFDSEKDAYKFFNAYSWEIGFGIKHGNKYINKNGFKTMQDLLCSCEGTHKKFNSRSSRTNCPVMVRLLRTEDDGWYYGEVVLEHNHELAASVGERRLWKCHKYVDSSMKDIVRHLRSNNVSLTKVYGVMADIHGSHDDVPFRKRSLKSMCASIAHECSQDDINKTLDLFTSMQAEETGFFFAVKTDEERRVSGLFWCHQKSRADYSCFGDAVTFDTTYKSNLYEMPVGLFVGVNNHYQCCLFGCVFLREETVESFKWAFETFLSAMDNKPPKTILTDQSRQMDLAIAHVMNSSKHVWCKWHVLKKMREKVGSMYRNGTPFRNDFNILINEMMTVEEFEKEWQEIMTHYGLEKIHFCIRFMIVVSNGPSLTSRETFVPKCAAHKEASA